MRGGLLATLIVVSLLSFGTATAAPIDAGNCIRSTESVETDYADVTAIVNQAPNRSNVVRIRYEQLSSDDRLEVQLPRDVQVVRATGFSNDSESATLRYTGESPAIFEYKIGGPQTEVKYANGSNWLFAPVPGHIGVGVNIEFASAGVVGNGFLYIGNYTEYSITRGCHTISLINAAAGDQPDSPEEILEALSYAASNLDIGHKYEEVTIFMTPGRAKPPHPGFAQSSDAWVTKSDYINGRLSLTRLVLHEYVHTRQAYNRGSIGGMSWVIEGSAEYFSYKLALETESVSAEKYNRWLQNGSKMNAVLTNRSSWNSRYVPYGRGGAFLAILDSRIQATSNNSIEHVFQRINAIGGDESYVLLQRHLFLDFIANASSPEVRSWANRTMDSPKQFNVSSVVTESKSDSAMGVIADTLEKRITEKPLMSFAVAIIMGIALGMLPYERRRAKRDESEDVEEGSEK